jgi:hypothetical protein
MLTRVFQVRHGRLMKLLFPADDFHSAYVGLRSGKRAGGRLKFLNVTKFVRDLLMITKLLMIFELFDSQAEALTSFAPEGV